MYKPYKRSWTDGKSLTTFAALVAAILIVLIAMTMFVWNYIVPDIFGEGAPTISFWQAGLLMVLGRLIAGVGSSSSK